MKIRIHEEDNYKGIYFNGKTIRIALDSTKPIKELQYPEFYDVKITSKCFGKCEYCYMDSKSTDDHVSSVVEKIDNFFGKLNENQRPFQVAIGGGEPTSHPDFKEVLKKFYELGITPNYTTNGMFIDERLNIEKIVKVTKKYCGGVALSCHSHLKYYWKNAANIFSHNDVKLNFHVIISDKKSVNDFIEIYNNWKHKVDYFVLLPHGAIGRGKEKEIEWEYLVSVMPEDTRKIAFGANFHNNLKKSGNKFKVSLYEPESMSKYLDLHNMKVYPSSFNLV